MGNEIFLCVYGDLLFNLFIWRNQKMSIENKPREYFDKWVPYYGNYLNGDASIQEQSQRYSIDQQAIVRVIEYRAVEQLKAELRTSDLNRQSLWADSVKMADELNYLKAKTDTEIEQLKSKLEIAKKGLEFYSLSCREEYGQLYNMAPSAEDKSVLVYAQVAIGSTARQALKEIGEG